MNTNNDSRRPTPPIDPFDRDEINTLLVRASRGELHAIEAIAVLYGPALAYAVGEPASFALVSQFADALMDAVPRHRLPRAVAMRWMSGVLDVVAHRHRRERADSREREGRDP